MQRQAERDNLTAMQDAGVQMIVSDPENYAAYLEVQGNNPMYSAGNIALAMVQNPNVTQIGTADRWKSLGRSVMDLEKNKGVQIFARGSFGKGYAISQAYDISQTVGRPVPAPRQLQENTKEMETALKSLMNYSLVPIVVNREQEDVAYYDSMKLEISVNPNFTEHETFAALAEEISHSRFHNKGRNIYYSRNDSALDAQSVSYLLCRRFGVKCQMPDLSNLTEQYNGWTAPEIRQALALTQDMSKQIGGSIEKSITPQQPNRGNVRRPTR